MTWSWSRVSLLALAVATAASTHAADEWGNVAIVSQTMGVSGSRICIGEATRGDIGCPTYAPSLTTAGDVSVTGNLSAVQFIGDGSLLTGVAAASSDRIVSGTGNATSMVAISSTGYISVTQAGANSAWFDPTKGLVTLGVSSTGGISGTTGYFSGNVGIGTTAPSAPLHFGGLSQNADWLKFTDGYGTGAISGGSGNLVLRGSAGGGVWGALVHWSKGVLVPSVGWFGFAAGSDQTGNGDTKISRLAAGKVSIDTSTAGNSLGALIAGSVGIGTTSPAKTLDVSGTANIASNTFIGGNATPSATLDVSGTIKVAGTGSETCGPTNYGAIRRHPTTGAIQICVNH